MSVTGANYFFFRAHRTNDLTKKLEKVGPYECDELEEHCRVSEKCDPTKVPALYTMAKVAHILHLYSHKILNWSQIRLKHAHFSHQWGVDR